MGYYTNYDLSENSQEVINWLENKSGYRFMNSLGNDIKWYDHEDHMLEASNVFVDQILYLNGNGEQQGDVWKKRFRNGTMEVIEANLVFGDFKFIV